MICIIALIVFGILGIFSLKYRIIAKEALDCTFKKITLRKCDTGLDTRLKSQITGKFLRFWPALGRAVYKYFEVFSWFFLILMLVTLFFMGQGIYNYAVYGNCNGPQGGFCIYDPLGTNTPHNASTGGQCSLPPAVQVNKTLTPPPLRDSPYLGNKDATVTIIEFGCYECEYTKKAEPIVKKILEKYGDKIKYVYKDFPLSPEHINAIRASEAAYCANDQGKYWEYREYLFANQQRLMPVDLIGYAKDLNLNTDLFKSCLDSEKYKPVVTQNYNDGLESGIIVTPTFFINNQAIKGAADFSEFDKAIRKELGIKWYEFWK